MAQIKPSSSRPTAVTIFRLVLACRRQSGVALVQPVLCFPGDLLDLFRHPLLSLAQAGPTAGRTITPGRFDGDSSQMCVACLGDASASRPLAAGVLAGNRSAVTHQLPRASKRDNSPNSATMVTAEICAMPRNACRPVITSCIAGEASLTASVMACSSRTTRSAMCSTSCR